METLIIGLIVGVSVGVILGVALCALMMSSGTKEEVDQKAIEHLTIQANGHNAELKKKYTE